MDGFLTMRIGFSLELQPGKAAEYDASHRQVWPEMLALLKESGVSQYSIFRRGNDIFLTFTCEDFEATWTRIEKSPVNTRWQEQMQKYFAPMAETVPGERFPMWREVFYLE